LTNTVWSIAPGKGSILWLGTAMGMQPFDCAKLVPLTSGPSLRGPAVIACGLLGDSTLWMATPEALRIIENANIIPRQVSPPVHITAFQVNARVIDPASKMEFPYDENSCTIEYVGICFADEKSVRYQYRLPDAMDEWSLPTDHHAVSFAGLKPGRYHFQVRAINNVGLVSQAPAMLDFAIQPPLWGEWWFRALAALALASAGFAVYRYRMNKILELARIRNRIARDLHDEVGSTLSSISFFTEALRNEMRAAGHLLPSRFLALISESSASARSAMRDIVWSLDPANDSWENLSVELRRYAADLLGSKHIRYALDIVPGAPGRAPTLEQRRNLWLVYKEIIVNAVKHAQCTEMLIRLQVPGKTLVLEISDNGQGFDPAGDMKGNGLRNIRERILAIGGRVKLETSPGTGTRWHIDVPL
jgi:signal transduction histidine kinase